MKDRLSKIKLVRKTITGLKTNKEHVKNDITKNIDSKSPVLRLGLRSSNKFFFGCKIDSLLNYLHLPIVKSQCVGYPKI